MNYRTLLRENRIYLITTGTSVFVTAGTPMLSFHFGDNDLICTTCDENIFVIQAIYRKRGYRAVA
jgi:hypothetical protein